MGCEWSMHAQIQIFFVREEGVQAQRRENSLDFLMLVLGFFSPKFSGDAGRGPTIYEGGGGFPDANFELVIYQGWGPGPLSPPLPLDLHMHDI